MAVKGWFSNQYAELRGRAILIFKASASCSQIYFVRIIKHVFKKDEKDP